MKVAELLEKNLVKGVWSAKPLKLLNRYSQKDLSKALRGKISAQTVTLKNAQTGEIVGKRTIMQAENLALGGQAGIPETHLAQLKTEKALVKEILSQMKKGYYVYAMALCYAAKKADRYSKEVETIHN